MPSSKGFCISSLVAVLLALGGCHAIVSSETDPANDPVRSSEEVCENGLDDDRDGAVDEGCSCSSGAKKSCFPGLPQQRGKGSCRDGTQRCEGDVELGGTWSACAGAVIARPEVCGDGIDQDCDGADLPCGGPGPAPLDAGSPGWLDASQPNWDPVKYDAL